LIFTSILVYEKEVRTNANLVRFPFSWVKYVLSLQTLTQNWNSSMSETSIHLVPKL